MSLVIAVKHDGYISFASDSRSTGDSFYVTSPDGPSGKLFSLPNGFVIGSVGNSAAKVLIAQLFADMKMSDSNPISAYRLETEVIPEVIRRLSEMGRIGDDFPKGDVGFRLLIGYRDKLYMTDEGTLTVYEIKERAAIGDISSIASLSLLNYSGNDIRGLMENVLERTAKQDNKVGPPWRFVDTDRPKKGKRL